MRISSAEARRRGYDPDEIARIEADEVAWREAAELIQLIDEVFTAIPKPKVTLLGARALDDEWIVSEERMAELAKQDPETDWREVSEEKTAACQEYFTFADAPGWRFYLPAYMTHYLREFPGYGCDAVYNACVGRMHLDDLTAEELDVVEKFVALCQKYEKW
jgi:hypothetical protein